MQELVKKTQHTLYPTCQFAEAEKNDVRWRTSRDPRLDLIAVGEKGNVGANFFLHMVLSKAPVDQDFVDVRSHHGARASVDGHIYSWKETQRALFWGNVVHKAPVSVRACVLTQDFHHAKKRTVVTPKEREKRVALGISEDFFRFLDEGKTFLEAAIVDDHHGQEALYHLL